MQKQFKSFLLISLLGLIILIILSPIINIINEIIYIKLFSDKLPLIIYLNTQFIAFSYLWVNRNNK